MAATAISPRDRLTVLSSKVDAVDMDSALDFVRHYVRHGTEPGYILAVNPEKAYSLLLNRWMRDFFSRATLLIPDGIGLVLAVRILLGRTIGRVPGADLMQRICAQAVENDYRLFVFGSSEDVNRRAVEVLRRRHPGIQIVGRLDGFSTAGDPDAAVRAINGAHADILFIALGSPRQEKWIADNLPALNVKLCQGIGGTLDTIAGTVQRAPAWVQSLGCEWLYRFLRQPTRASRIVVVFRFALLVLAARLRG